jgi:hypothetical protein
MIHCLVLANTDASVALAMRLFRIRPKLLLTVHKTLDKTVDKTPGSTGARNEYAHLFDGEGSLHILAANSRVDELCEALQLARDHFSDRQARPPPPHVGPLAVASL